MHRCYGEIKEHSNIIGGGYFKFRLFGKGLWEEVILNEALEQVNQVTVGVRITPVGAGVPLNEVWMNLPAKSGCSQMYREKLHLFGLSSKDRLYSPGGGLEDAESWFGGSQGKWNRSRH